MKYYINRLTQVQTLLQQRQKDVATSSTKTVDNNLDIVITRATQNNETDLHYLERIAREYGFIFSIKGSHMIFYVTKQLQGRAPSLTLTESQLTRYKITDKLAGTYSAATVKYHHPKKNKVITGTAKAGDNILFPLQPGTPEVKTNSYPLLKDYGLSDYNKNAQAEETAPDVLEIKDKAETDQQAEAKAKAALHEANTNACSGSFDTDFNILCCSGNNVELHEIGEYSGIFHIGTAKFTVSKSGGSTVSCDIKRVGFVQQKRKKRK